MDKKIIIFIIFIFVIGYVVYKERQALGCGNFFEGKDCDNANGKAVRGTSPHPGDDTLTLLNKIDVAANYHSRFVQWRVFFLLAISCMLILWLVIFKRLPTLWEGSVGFIILFLAFILTSSFYKFHLSDHIKTNIEQCTNSLRNMPRQKINM